MDDSITPQNIKESIGCLTDITARFSDAFTEIEWLLLLKDILENSLIMTDPEAVVLLILASKESAKDKDILGSGIQKFLLGHSQTYFKNILIKVERAVIIPFLRIPVVFQNEDKLTKSILTYRLKVGK